MSSGILNVILLRLKIFMREVLELFGFVEMSIKLLLLLCFSLEFVFFIHVSSTLLPKA